MPWRLVWRSCLVILVFVVGFAGRAATDGRLHLFWIDSEGGGSTLVVTPTGESVLIDAGNPGGRDAARIHRVATQVAGLTRIHHLIVTHFHLDHFGGAAELAGLMPIDEIWDNGLPQADPDGRRESTWPLTSKSYRELNVRERHRVSPGTLVPLRTAGTPLFLRCMIARQEVWKPTPEGVATWSPRTAVASTIPAKARDTSDNANSSAWVLGFGGFRFYDGGDLTWNAEASLVHPEILVPEVDVCQVTHHGLDVSNHPDLLRALNPRVTIMNNGPTKGTMAEVMQTLRALPDLRAQYQVHQNTRPDGATNNVADEFMANLGAAAECEGHFVQASVASDGASYSFRIPARGHERTYPVRQRTR